MRKSKLKFLAGAALAVTLGLGITVAIADIVNGVEIDGNIRNQNSDPAATLDWASKDGAGPPTTATGCIIDEAGFGEPAGDECSDGEDDHAFIQDETSQQSATDPDIFGGGAKEVDETSWSFVSGNIPSKDDFRNVYAWHDEDGAGDTILYGAFEKREQNGDTHLDFELSQEVEDCGLDGEEFFCPVRNIGDLILAFDLNPDSGPATKEALTVKLFEIVDGGGGVPVFDETPILSAAVTNAERVTLGDGLDLSDEIDPDLCVNLDIDGTCPAQTLVVAVNNIDIEAGPWKSTQGNSTNSATVKRTNFFEFSLNLNEVDLEPTCPGAAFLTVKSRASNSIDAQLKDTTESVPFDLSTCGSVIIKKESIGGFGAFDFQTDLPEGSPNPASNDFTLTTSSLNNPVQITFPQVTPGTYTASETGVASGFAFKDVICDDGINPDNSTPNTTPGAQPATIRVETNETVTCTFRNERGTLDVTKQIVNQCVGDANDGGLFNLKIDTTVVATDVGDGGGTDPAVNVSIGSHTVSETAGTGTSLSDYISAISGDCDTGGLVNVGGGENKACTITNTAKAKVTVTKVLIGIPGDDGVFDLKVGATTVADDVGDGGSGSLVLSGPFPQATSVSEAAGTDTDLVNYNESITCDNGFSANNAGPLGFSVVSGEEVQCTIYNIAVLPATACPAPPTP